MNISIFEGPISNTNLSSKLTSWLGFTELLSQPAIGKKDGSYFTRGYCDGPRMDKNMRSLDFVIIDGDRSLSNPASCCSPLVAHNAMIAEGITHLIYTSHSHDPANNILKWRLLVPCKGLTADNLVRGTADIIAILQKGGATVKPVKENTTLSQGWFFPRYPADRKKDFIFKKYIGTTYKIAVENVLEKEKRKGKEFDMFGGPESGVRGEYFEQEKEQKNGTSFNWEEIFDSFESGTSHMGLTAAAGWLVRTTDWTDKQMAGYLMALVGTLCPDKEKVARASAGEITKIIKYCRLKSNTGRLDIADWKNHLISADELQGHVFPPIKWAVDRILPEGFTVLAGDPKIGKSLLAVDVCSAVAAGSRAFGDLECMVGDAIYLSFEDPARRIQQRIKNQCDTWPGKFHIVENGIPQLGLDFYRIMDEMMSLWPDTRVVFLDTLQFVIPQKAAGVNDYEHYCKVLDPLHRWALDNHVAVCGITHRTKAKMSADENPFSGIIGSVAIQSNADALIILAKNYKKDENNASDAEGYMIVGGREVPSSHFSMEFNSEEVKWVMSEEQEGEGINVKKKSNNEKILDVLQLKTEIAPKEISDLSKINISTVKSCLKRLAKRGLVENIKHGQWRIISFFDRALSIS